MLQNLTVLTEKTVLTFLEVFVTALIAATTITVSIGWEAVGIATISAALTVVANGVGNVELNLGNPVADTVGRAIRTFVVSFLGFLIAAPVVSYDIDTLKAAAWATLPAVLAIIKGTVASRVGDKNTAALVPASLDVSRNI